jgi:septal ring factor EnvC (AmiA/AmiB activator)
MILRVRLILLGLLLLLSDAVFGQTDPRIETSLVRISNAISALEAELKFAREQEAKAGSEVEQADVRLRDIKEEGAEVLRDIQQNRLLQDQERVLLAKAQSELESFVLDQGQRLKRLYIHGRAPMAPRAAESASISPGLFLKYSARFLEQDKNLIQSLRDRQKKIEERTRTLSKLSDIQQTLKQELSRRQNEAEQELAELNALKAKFQGERKKVDQKIAALKREAAGLSGVVSEIVSPPSKVESSTGAPELLGGLKLGAAKLAAPVSGKIVQGFGSSKLAQFDDLLFSKGLEFQAKQASPVSVVALGKVAFTGMLPGYGLVAIVDHGARFHSLYGRLGKVLVKPGAVLKAGSSLALAGEPDRNGRNFYFELRHNGKPVNPSPYLKIP